MIYITGDTHGQFHRIMAFCHRMEMSADDVLIILGDAGFNYSGSPYDDQKKRYLSTLPNLIFSIHGNHEQRPYTIPTYREMQWRGGTVYVEDDYPTLLFAKDGEIYDLDGKKTLVIGGAYSVDKEYRLMCGYRWWEDEQPSEEIKQRVEQKLDSVDWKVDVALSHTVPLKYEPIECFLSGIDQSKVDKSTEIWLDKIEDKLTYQKWYAVTVKRHYVSFKDKEEST